ncbi:MAG: 50S ribosomal protein L3 N(5)-glutamine methyltransferase [Betaproteobacteria bacterium]|nr:50S ribosomal protein L3 N(5)-glutamine methyltransferase [Betaproteobacteria bacterium]
MTTFAALLAKATRALARANLTYGHGTLDDAEEALVLVAHALGLSLARVDTVPRDKPVSAAACAKAMALIAARIKTRRPAAYLTGEAWLQGLRFFVDERVIVPRSFIAELLAEKLSPWIETKHTVQRALDLCTGSGCLAILLAKVFRNAKVDAVDLSSPALQVARRNIARHRMTKRVRPVESDLFSALGKKRYDLIISNPPYVTTATMRRLPPEYRREPAMALAGGSDGFELVNIILREAANHLTSQGSLVVEIGHHRRRLERAYPGLPFIWPETSGGDDCVFVLRRADLVAPGALRKRPARRRAI